jgi:hypothetical protein
MPAQHWTKTVSLQGCIAVFLMYYTSIPLVYATALAHVASPMMLDNLHLKFTWSQINTYFKCNILTNRLHKVKVGWGMETVTLDGTLQNSMQSK